jgi:hypothetical protein
MEVVKAMIHDQDLPMHLWSEETMIAIYVQKIFYIPGHRRIKASRVVTFDEDTIFNRSRQSHSNEFHGEDHVAP